MTDDQHEKTTLENIFRTKSERIVKKPKRYTNEVWYNLFLTSGCIINKKSRDRKRLLFCPNR